MKNLDVTKLKYQNKYKLTWKGEKKLAYLCVHEGDPSLEHCTITSVPFDLKLVEKTYPATVTVDMGWCFQGSMNGLWVKIGSKSGQNERKSGLDTRESGLDTYGSGLDTYGSDLDTRESGLPTKLTVFKFRYGLPDPNGTHDVRGYLPTVSNDTQNECDGYSRTHYAYLAPGEDEVKTILHDFRGDEMTIETATKD